MLLVLASAPAARAGDVPPDAVYSSATITSSGQTHLHADVFLPRSRAPGQRVPVILIVGPYFGAGSGTDTTSPHRLSYYDSLFAQAFARGYAIVQVTLRGRGASDGCQDLGGPAEQDDAAASVAWAASQPWSTGRVGMWGLSYDGWTQLMAAARHPPGLAALVLMGPVVSAYRTQYMNGLLYSPFAALLKAYHGLFAAPSLAANDPGQLLPVSARATCPLDVLERSDPDPASPYWRERDLLPALRGSRLPILWSHGLMDANVKPDAAYDLWTTLSGPHRAWFGQYPHVVPDEAELGHPELLGRGGFDAEAFRWLDHYVKGTAAAPSDPSVEVQEGFAGRWRAEDRWPPADAHPMRVSLLPGSYDDSPGNKGEAYCTPQPNAGLDAQQPGCAPGPTGVGTWTFTQSLPYDVWMAGEPSLDVTLDSGGRNVHVVGLLYDVDELGHARLISRGGDLFTSAGHAAFALYPQDWLLRAGHRIGVLLSAADDLWFESPTSMQRVPVRGGRLDIPVLRYTRDRFLPGGPSLSVSQRTWFALDPALIAGREVRADLPGRLIAQPPSRSSVQRLLVRFYPRRRGRGGGPLLRMHTNHGRLTHLRLTLSRAQHTVARARVRRVGPRRIWVTLHRTRESTLAPGRYRLTIRRGRRVLLRRRVRLLPR